MATKALNYTTAEINQRLNLAGTAVQPDGLNSYYTKTEVDSMVVVDLSVRYATSYASLSAALTALNADTNASAIKVGGMSIKFINSTTSKYEQWNLKASSWSTTESDWVSVTDVKAEDISYENSNVKEVIDEVKIAINGGEVTHEDIEDISSSLINHVNCYIGSNGAIVGGTKQSVKITDIDAGDKLNLSKLSQWGTNSSKLYGFYSKTTSEIQAMAQNGAVAISEYYLGGSENSTSQLLDQSIDGIIVPTNAKSIVVSYINNTDSPEIKKVVDVSEHIDGLVDEVADHETRIQDLEDAESNISADNVAFDDANTTIKAEDVQEFGEIVDEILNGGIRDVVVETDITEQYVYTYHGYIKGGNNCISATSKADLFLFEIQPGDIINITNMSHYGVNSTKLWAVYSATPTDIYNALSSAGTYYLDGSVASSQQSLGNLTEYTVPANAKTLAVSHLITDTTNLLSVTKKTTEQREVNGIVQDVEELKNGVESILSIVYIGDSTSYKIQPYIKKWADANNIPVKFVIEGGNNTLQLGAYSGAIPVVTADSYTIPQTGAVNMRLKSTYLNSSKENVDVILKHWSTENSFTLGLNPVIINGVVGNLSRDNNLVPYGVAFYASDGTTLIAGFSTYGNKTVSLSSVSYMRICINANNSDDVASNSAHVDINGSASLPFPASVFTEAGKYINSSGSMVAKQGFYTSELIAISDSTITSLYLDGLADNDTITFTRLESGDAVIVESGAAIISTQYPKYEKSVLLTYINNIYRGGRNIEEELSLQFNKLANVTKTKQYVLGLSHWQYESYTPTQIQAINSALKFDHDNHYFSGYHYLSQCGINDIVRYGALTQSQVNGYTWQEVFLTSDDPIGTTPANVHENIYGAYLLARKMIERGAELGYWEIGDVSWSTLSQ